MLVWQRFRSTFTSFGLLLSLKNKRSAAGDRPDANAPCRNDKGTSIFDGGQDTEGEIKPTSRHDCNDVKKGKVIVAKVACTSEPKLRRRSATQVSNESGRPAKRHEGAAASERQPTRFDEFEEVDTEHDKPYFLKANPESVLGYLSSEGEDEAACVICTYVNPSHRSKHALRPTRISMQIERRDTPITTDKASEALCTSSSLTQKRPLTGLAWSKYNTSRNVKPRLDTPIIHTERDLLGATEKPVNSPSVLDGQAETLKRSEAPDRPDLEHFSTSEALDIFPYALKAGQLVSDPERALAHKRDPSLTSADKPPAKRKQQRPPTPPLPDDEQHHSLASRLRRDSDTTALFKQLAHTAGRRGFESYRVRSRNATKNACAQCLDERLVTPLLCRDGTPCSHRPGAAMAASRRSVYKVQVQDGEPDQPDARHGTRRRAEAVAWRPGARPETWCYCGMAYTGRAMYQCGNEECFTGWFHDACLRAARSDGKVPWRGKGDWCCDTCVETVLGAGSTRARDRAPRFSSEEIGKVFGLGFGRAKEDLSHDVYGLALTMGQSG